jgi:uncharacterized membrane protein YidH (DUF202 family)
VTTGGGPTSDGPAGEQPAGGPTGDGPDGGEGRPSSDPADRPALVSERFGAQAERTEMAWVRTTLACAGLAALAARLLADTTSLPVLVALGVLVAVPGLVASWWRVAGLRVRPEPLPAPTAGVAMLAGSVAVVDLVVLVAVFR